jgi:hypothetical protein
MFLLNVHWQYVLVDCHQSVICFYRQEKHCLDVSVIKWYKMDCALQEPANSECCHLSLMIQMRSIQPDEPPLRISL